MEEQQKPLENFEKHAPIHTIIPEETAVAEKTFEPVETQNLTNIWQQHMEELPTDRANVLDHSRNSLPHFNS